MDMSRDEIVFSLCYHQMKKFKNCNPQSKEDAEARLIIAEELFVLAAAAAVRNGFRKESTDCMVNLMEEVREHLGRFAKPH